MSDPKTQHPVAVGTQFWFVPQVQHHGPARPLVVLKVGRRWLSLGNPGGHDVLYRADRETLHVDGGGWGCPGRLYPSRKEWEAESRAHVAWEALVSFVRPKYRRPEHLSAERIEEALAILKPRDGDPAKE